MLVAEIQCVLLVSELCVVACVWKQEGQCFNWLMTVLTVVSWLLHLSLVMPSQDSDLPPKEREKMAEFQVRYFSVILYCILSFSGTEV